MRPSLSERFRARKRKSLAFSRLRRQAPALIAMRIGAGLIIVGIALFALGAALY